MSNPHLGNLLSKSKFAQLAKSNQLMSLRTSKLFPVAQTIETTSGSFKLRDYGLKSALPARRNRIRIVVDEVDTIENMTAYERAPGDFYRKMKFNELDIPMNVTGNRETRSRNPLFYGATTDRIINEQQLYRARNSEILNMTHEMSKSAKNKILEQLRDQRSNFMKFLAENNPEKYISIRKGDLKRDKLDSEISEFLIKLNKEEGFAPAKTLAKAAQNDNTRPIMKATGGLSFKLGGKLRTTPNGVESQGAIVPARLLKPNGDSYEVAVGGFVARASPATVGKLVTRAAADKTKHLTQQTIPVQISSANLNANGTVHLNVEAIEAKTIRNNKSGDLNIPLGERKSVEVTGDTIMRLLLGYPQQ